MSLSKAIEEYRQKKNALLAGGGVDRIEKQHQAGKLTARERIFLLVDAGSFVEMDAFVMHRSVEFGMEKQKILGDGVVTGFGTVNGQKIFLYAQDFTVFGGSLSGAHAQKICKLMDMALKVGAPVIGLTDSGGARIQEGVESLGGYAEIFWRNTQASGVIPQISLIMGPSAGGAVYSPAITDFIFMVEHTSHLFVTGPDVIKTVTHENVSKEELGGAEAHGEKSGVAHFVCKSELDAINRLKELLKYIPANNRETVLPIETSDSEERACDRIEALMPEASSLPYDITEIILEVVDDRNFFEVQEGFAKNIVVGFAKLGGMNIGIVANQPNHLAGCLDINASLKAARFVRFCDAFSIPIISLVDVPGFLPGVSQEHNGIIKHGAKLLYAYCEATVPKITLITRKAYGGAYDVMASKHIRADFNFAYPNAEIAVMGPEGAARILYRKELDAAEKNGTLQQVSKELSERYRNAFAHPYRAAELGYIDAVIEPAETRTRLIQALRMASTKQEVRPKRKHGNIPL